MAIDWDKFRNKTVTTTPTINWDKFRVGRKVKEEAPKGESLKKYTKVGQKGLGLLSERFEAKPQEVKPDIAGKIKTVSQLATPGAITRLGTKPAQRLGAEAGLEKGKRELDLRKQIAKERKEGDVPFYKPTPTGLARSKEVVGQMLEEGAKYGGAVAGIEKKGAELTGRVVKDFVKRVAPKAKELQEAAVDFVYKGLQRIRKGGIKVPFEYFDEAQNLTKKIEAGKATVSDIGRGREIIELSTKAAPKELGVKPYVEKGELSTKILKDLEGKATVSKQYILDATNRGGLKQVERNLIREALKTENVDTINIPKFAEKVKRELLPLERQPQTRWNPKAALSGAKYENITLPKEIRGNVKNYFENIYQSPVQTSSGSIHFSQGELNYFGHTRVEDMADNSRRIIEVQSDLYQKGNLESKISSLKDVDDYGTTNLKYRQELFDQFPKNEAQKKWEIYLNEQEKLGRVAFKKGKIDLQKLQQYNDPTAHFRMVREEVKQAAIDGKTKLQFPTGETAMKIEGLGVPEGDRFRIVGNLIKSGDYKGFNKDLGLATFDKLKVGQEITESPVLYGNAISDTEGIRWIVTDVIGDGKFKVMPKEHFDSFIESKGIDNLHGEDLINYAEAHATKNFWNSKETFDVSGKVDTKNPIYKFYEKDVQKYLKNKYSSRKVVDDNGVSWFEVNIKPEYGNLPVEAFGLGAGVEVDEEGKITGFSPEKAALGFLGMKVVKGKGTKISKAKKASEVKNIIKKEAQIAKRESKIFLKGIGDDVKRLMADNMAKANKESLAKMHGVDPDDIIKIKQRGGTTIITKQDLESIKKIPDYDELTNNLLEKSGRLGRIFFESRDVIRSMTKDHLLPMYYVFDELGEGAKSLFWRPIVKAKGIANAELKSSLNEFKEVTRGLSGKSSERIMKHALSKEPGGGAILDANDLREEALTPLEKKAYDYMRQKFDTWYEEINKARQFAGKDPFPKRTNYFTHSIILNNFERETGKTIAQADLDSIMKYIHRNTQAFGSAKRRLGGTRIELDAFNVFKKYQNKAIEIKNLTPTVAHLRELTNTLIPYKGEKFSFKKENPRVYDIITEWLDYTVGQAPIDFFDKIPLAKDALLKLQNNMAFAVLGGSLRSAAIQGSAIIQSAVSLGPTNIAKGIIGAMKNPKEFTKFIDESEVLDGRVLDAAIESVVDNYSKTGKLLGGISRSKQKLGALSLKPLQAFDSLTAGITGYSGYLSKLADGKTKKEAINFADDLITKTQASAEKYARSPIQRTTTGKMFTLFQTFVINNWAWLRRDVLGTAGKQPTKESIRKLMYYIGGIALYNTMADKFGLPTPFPEPIKTYKEAKASGKNRAFEVLKDLASEVPILSNLAFGKGIGEIPIAALTSAAYEKATGKYTPQTAFQLAGQATGLPGTNQIQRMITGLKAVTDGYTIRSGGKDVKIKPSETIDILRTLGFGRFEMKLAEKTRMALAPRKFLKTQLVEAYNKGDGESFVEIENEIKEWDKEIGSFLIDLYDKGELPEVKTDKEFTKLLKKVRLNPTDKNIKKWIKE